MEADMCLQPTQFVRSFFVAVSAVALSAAIGCQSASAPGVTASERWPAQPAVHNLGLGASDGLGAEILLAIEHGQRDRQMLSKAD
jgi:hypothetical protein